MGGGISTGYVFIYAKYAFYLSDNTLVFYDSRAPVRDCFAKLTAYAAQTGSAVSVSTLHHNENFATVITTNRKHILL